MANKSIGFYSNEEAEQILLSYLLIDNNLIDLVKNQLEVGDFFYSYTGEIYKIILDLYNAYKTVDITIFERKLKENPKIGYETCEYILKKEIKDITIINKLKAINIYANIIKKLSKIRGFLQFLNQYTKNKQKEFQGRSITDNFIDTTTNLFYKKLYDIIDCDSIGNKQYSIDEIVDKCIEEYEYIKKTGKNKVVLTGFADLDNKLKGLHRTDLILLAGRPAMGKTAFSLNILRNIAFNNKLPIVFFSLEMSKKQLVERLFSMETKINLQKISGNELNQDEMHKLYEASDKLRATNIYICDMANLTVEDIRMKSLMLKNRHNELGVIIIDYLQLINCKTFENRNQEISRITRSLKQLAKEVDVPIILLSQLSRAVEQRSSHRPILSDLRDSGAIEQDADIVMFIYRQAVYEEIFDDDSVELIIAKHRNGPTGTVELKWDGECVIFNNNNI